MLTTFTEIRLTVYDEVFTRRTDCSFNNTEWFFWFYNQSPSCHFFCPEDEGYLFEKAIASWKSTKQPHPRCDGHQKLARMRVVKNLLELTYGRPFFVCSDKMSPCSYWVWGDVRPITKPECRPGSPCVIRKVKKEGLTTIFYFLLPKR